MHWNWSTDRILAATYYFLGPSEPRNVTSSASTIEQEEPEYPNGIIKYYIVNSSVRECYRYTINSSVREHYRYTINNLDSKTTYSISASGGA